MRSTTNQHHGMPRSFDGGNDSSVNITTIDIEEHDLFHQLAGHLPPDFLIRQKVLETIGWHDGKFRMLPPSFYDDMFAILTPHDWRELYHSRTFRMPSSAQKAKSHAALHIFTSLGAEITQIHDAIACLGGSKDYIAQTSQNALKNFMFFFRAKSPVRSMQNYLADTNEVREYKWTKPLIQSTRRDLGTALSDTRLETMTANSHERIIWILRNQKKHIERSQEEWEPTFDQYITQAAEQGQKNALCVRKKHKRD